MPPDEFNEGHFLAVRTFGQVHLFDIRHRAAPDRSSSPYALSELVTLDANNFDAEPVMDMSFSQGAPTTLNIVTRLGCGFRLSLREDRHSL